MPAPRIAVGPARPVYVTQAIAGAGGEVGDLDEAADGLVWLDIRDPEPLRRAVAATGARWVQLPLAGVERVHAAGLLSGSGEVVWTSAKGAYAKPVAEHAVMLALAGLRLLPADLLRPRHLTLPATPPHRRAARYLGAGSRPESRAVPPCRRRW